MIIFFPNDTESREAFENQYRLAVENQDKSFLNRIANWMTCPEWVMFMWDSREKFPYFGFGVYTPEMDPKKPDGAYLRYNGGFMNQGDGWSAHT